MSDTYTAPTMASNEPVSSDTDVLPRRRLGRTNLQVTAIGMGGAGVGGEVPEADGVAAVEAALAGGVNYLDTSPLYGDSETRFGIALRGISRESYVLSTKTGTHRNYWKDYSGEATRWTVSNSLKLLGVDYIDLLLVHDPDDIEPVFALGGALDVLEELKAEGVIRSIGLGQRRHDWHRRAIDSGRFDAILTYNDYHPLRTTALSSGLLEAAHASDVGVINGSPFAFGLLAGKPAPWANFENTREGEAGVRFLEWCRANDISAPAVALQFCLRQRLIQTTLTGAATAKEVEENLNAARETLPDDVWDELDKLNLTHGQE